MDELTKVKTGKAYESLTADEKKLITDFTPEQHDELKKRFGNRLRHLHIDVDDDEKYDFLVVRPSKDVLLAMASHKDDLGAANELLLNNCIVAGYRDALEDATVYTAVTTALGQMIAGQATFINKA